MKAIAFSGATLFVFLTFMDRGEAQEAPQGQNLMSGGDMTNYTDEVNPWSGLDRNGNLCGLSADQLAVATDGTIGKMQLSPSVAIGDLNGDGLPDLVVADPKGFFWFFPN